MKRAYFLVLASLIALPAVPAMADEVCHGDFQKIDGSWVATPYCKDHHIAEFSDREGNHVTMKQVEKNSLLIEELCDSGPGLEASCDRGGDEQ